MEDLDLTACTLGEPEGGLNLFALVGLLPHVRA